MASMSSPSWADISHPDLDSPLPRSTATTPFPQVVHSLTHTPAVWLGNVLLHLLIGPTVQSQRYELKAETGFTVAIVAEKVV